MGGALTPSGITPGPIQTGTETRRGTHDQGTEVMDQA